MDITIQILGRESTHALSAEKEAGRVIQGGIINIFDSTSISESPNPLTRLLFIHITGVPISDILEVSYLLEPVFDTTDVEIQTVIRRNKWIFDILEATESEILDLTDLREITIAWDRAKDTIRNTETDILLTNILLTNI